ncbi:MAG TPA: P1 family peptidase [Acidimicrobiales bacterium]|nr:P1 family peptidase [Acidimicrobiales bacterium]
MLTELAGVRVGHWTDETARTGCTVVLLPPGTVASGEVRGGAPGTREWALLAPERMAPHVDAVVLSGGSAFGLAACDGVVRWCEEQVIGLSTPAGTVPIVVGAVLFDLPVGDPSVRPGADAGYAAAKAATGGTVATGLVGAGTGATVGKWRGPDAAVPAGIGTATERQGDLLVSALIAVNAFGDVVAAPDASAAERPEPGAEVVWPAAGASFGALESTTIGVVVTNAALTKTGCFLVAQSAHDGLARAIEPAHTTVDGDAIATAALGEVEAPLDLVRFLGARAVAEAVRSTAGPSSRSS